MLKTLFLSLKDLNFRQVNTLSAARITVATTFIVVTLTIFIFDIILKPEPPEITHYLNLENKNSLVETLKWHISHNPGAILPEDDSCSIFLKDSQKETAKNLKAENLTFELYCQSLDIKVKGSLTPDERKKITALISNSSDFWSEPPSETKITQVIAFNPFTLNLSGQKIATRSQGILGKELNVEVEIEATSFSDSFKEISELLIHAKLKSKKKEYKPIFEPKLIKNNLVFRDNRYGFYLPVKAKTYRLFEEDK